MNDTLPGDEPHTGPSHFAAFIEQSWKPVKLTPSGTSLDIPGEWQAAWNCIRDATALTEDEFEDFIRDCELDFDFQVLDSSGVATTPAQRAASQDVERLSSELQRTVASPERVVHLSRDKLLRRLNWTERFEFRHHHNFPVDDRLYQPIKATVSELTEAIQVLPGGYIVLEGDPGSGKSSLLTKTLRTLDERLVYYYAYIPDAAYSNATRGESVNFLHDVSLELERHGFTVGGGLTSYNRDLLLRRLFLQLGRLGENWKLTGRKTIILIDGLDHIVRDQNPTASLLDDLPEPGQVPEGVYFVLGTQTVSLLSPRIRQSIREPLRTISMKRLDRLQVHLILEAADMPTDVSQDQCDHVYSLSDGHPLFLAYLIKKMSSCQSEEELNQLLAESGTYDGNIEDNYQSYWDQFRDDQPLRHLLGLLARIRRPIDLEWVREWADIPALERLGESFSHYFRIEDSTRWHFFHNGFRLFLVSKTAEFPPGTPDDTLDSSFHVKLADLCASQSPDAFWAWEEIYHRASAGQHDDVLTLSTQEYFRRQFLALRPVSAIQSDILTALRSAAINQDSQALIRLCLIGSETNQRGEYIDPVSIVSLLLKLGIGQTAIEHLRTGNQLHVVPGVALESAILLLSLGMESEAQGIFHLAEPPGLMPGSDLPDFHNVTESMLADWVKLATWFRELDQVIGRIKGTAVRENYSTGVDSETATHNLHSRLLSCVAGELAHQERWSEIADVLDAFDLTHSQGVKGLFWFHHQFFQGMERAGNSEKAKEHLDAMLAIDETDLGSEELTALAEGVYRSLEDEAHARVLLQNIQQPELQTQSTYPSAGLERFQQRFRLNRLLWVLGNQQSPSVIIPASPGSNYYGLVLFERAICKLAQISARAWLGHSMSVEAIREESLPLIRLFTRSQDEPRGWAAWQPILTMQGEFCALLVKVVKQHGVDALKELSNNFQSEWDSPEYGRYWPSEDRRRVILAFLEEEFSREWARERLSELDQSIQSNPEVQGRVAECLDHAKAWLVAGDQDQAERFLTLALEEGFGVGYHKDYQLNKWINLVDRFNAVEPEGAAARLSDYALAIESLKDSADGDAMMLAANELLAAAFHWNPLRGIQLFPWFLDRGLIDYTTGLSILAMESLRGTDPPLDSLVQVVRQFIIPLHRTGAPDLLTFLIKRIGDLRGEDEAIEVVMSLDSAVMTYSSPSARREWLKGLFQGVEDAGLPNEIATLDRDDGEPLQDYPSSGSLLKFRDGSEQLTVHEVESRVTSILDLQQLLELESEESFFDWTPVVARLIQDTLRPEDLLILVDLLGHKRYSYRVLTFLARKLSEQGNKQSAWEVGLEALNASSNYGWNTRWDGGSRLHVFKALETINEDEAIPLLYETIVDDIGGNTNIIGDVVEELSEVLELLAPAISISEVWPNVEDHTDALLQNVLPQNPEGVFCESVIQSSQEGAAFIELIAVQLDHPCIAVSLAAQRSLFELLAGRQSEVASVLEDFLHRSESHQERVLMLLDAVSSIDPESISGLREAITGLLSSANWLVRRMSFSIINKCGWDFLETAPSSTNLSPIYDFALPSNLAVPGDTSADSSAHTTDLSTPTLVVRSFNSEIGEVSNVAGIAPRNLATRVIQIMESLPVIDVAELDRVDSKLRSSLEDVGLRMPHVSLGERAVRRAISHAVAELDDAGRISPSGAEYIEFVLRTYDPDMLLLEPSRRPKEVPSMEEINILTNLDEWVERVEEALLNSDWEPDDNRVVLAEETIVTDRGTWEIPAEIRLRTVESLTHSRAALEINPFEMFGITSRCLVSEYLTLQENVEATHLVIQNRARSFKNHRSNWIALNPEVGLRLRWSLAPDGMFRWVDSQGDIMVETIWWKDGPIESSMMGRSNEVAEGWIVLVSRAALEALQSEFGPLSKETAVVRQFRKEGEPISRTVTSRSWM